MATQTTEDIIENILIRLTKSEMKLDNVAKAFEGLVQYCMDMFANMVATLAGDAISALVSMIPYIGPSLAPMVRTITTTYIQGSFKTYNGYVI